MLAPGDGTADSTADSTGTQTMPGVRTQDPDPIATRGAACDAKGGIWARWPGGRSEAAAGPEVVHGATTTGHVAQHSAKSHRGSGNGCRATYLLQATMRVKHVAGPGVGDPSFRTADGGERPPGSVLNLQSTGRQHSYSVEPAAALPSLLTRRKPGPRFLCRACLPRGRVAVLSVEAVTPRLTGWDQHKWYAPG